MVPVAAARHVYAIHITHAYIITPSTVCPGTELRAALASYIVGQPLAALHQVQF